MRMVAALLSAALAPSFTACKTDAPSKVAPPPPALPTQSAAKVESRKSTFRTLQPGVEYATFDLPNSQHSDSKLHVVRIDPALSRPVLSAAQRSDGPPRTAKQWAQDGRFAVVINAGMYAQDMTSHVGHMRAYGQALEPAFNKDYQSVVAWGPRKPGMPALDILDLDSAPSEKRRAQDFDVAIQNLRLIKGPGENVWTEQPKRWSEAALAVDKNGKLLFLFTRSPYSMHELNQRLLALPLDIVKAQHLEGGPEASLSIHAGGVDLDLSGSYETGFTEHDDNHKQWVLPNVIGIESASALSLTFPMELTDLCDRGRVATPDAFSDAEGSDYPEAARANCGEVEQALSACSTLQVECEPDRTRVLRSGKGFLLRDGGSGSGAFSSTETYVNPAECRTLSIAQEGTYGEPFVSVSFSAAPNAITASERATLLRIKHWSDTDPQDPAHALSAGIAKPQAKRVRTGDVEIRRSPRGNPRAYAGRPQLQAQSLTPTSDGFALSAMLPESLTALTLDDWELGVACYGGNRQARLALSLYDRRTQKHRWIAGWPEGSAGGRVRLVQRKDNLLFAQLHDAPAGSLEPSDIVIDLDSGAYFLFRPTATLSGQLAELTAEGLRWSQGGHSATLAWSEIAAVVAAQRGN